MGRSQSDKRLRSRATRAKGIQRKAAAVGGLTDLPIAVLYLDESGNPAGFQSHKGLLRYFGLDNLIKRPSNPHKILSQDDMQKLLAKRNELLQETTSRQSPFQFISASDDVDETSSPSVQSTGQVIEEMSLDSSDSDDSTSSPSVSPPTQHAPRTRQLLSFFPQGLRLPLQ